MKSPKKVRRSRKSRKGTIAAITALLLLAILGLVACALDIGWIEMTRTQLQSAADASSLAGGTELIDGLGYFATKTPDEVVDAATPVAIEFAGYNRNADLDSTLVDGDRDIEFGKATFESLDDGGCGCWKKTSASEGAEYYNYVAVKVLRNQAGSTAGDGPVPLFFAKIFGINEKSLRASATAAILPANGFRVDEGSDDTADVAPFALKDELWERFRRAQKYYDDNPDLDLSESNPDLESIKDVDGPDPDAPLFGALNEDNEFVQLSFDDYTRTEAGGVSSGADGTLETSIYTGKLDSPGNWGTVDFGGTNNSTSDLSRQIRDGLDADDLSYYDNNQIVLSIDDPLDANGDTGEYSPLKAPLEEVRGQCKAIALFRSVVNPGNNANFELVKFVSVTVVHVNLTGTPVDREVRVQRCTLVDDNAVPDVHEEISPNTTIFTPLILIR
jgi:hypothetical protein